MIRKAKLQVTVLYDTSEVDETFFNVASLADIGGLISDGPAIGSVSYKGSAEVKKLRFELLNIGNDGTFFATDE